MISFECDYTTGAHPKVLQRLIDTNMEILEGYGSDKYTVLAKKKIKKAFDCPEADVFFLTGGTQTNQVVISTILNNYEGVIAAHTGHVSLHEAGAIEYTGHKVLGVPCENGKIKAETVRTYLETYYNDESHEHMVRPGMVYISFPTEYGTLYSKKELKAIYSLCNEYNIPLFIDGARLGYALASEENDISMADLASLCDVFYIGGTKVGALCGEAVVYTHANAPLCMLGQLKQHGALLAKGRLNGVQFDTLFTDGLYMEISKNAISKASQLKAILKEAGYEFYLDSPTNQQFVIMTNKNLADIRKYIRVSFWEKYDDERSVVRFATSWSTTDEDIQYLRDVLLG